jgi:dipeptidyl aminopeptidase/acylaminoacyl peptidase
MTDERLMRSLGAAFDDLAAARTPDYLEAAIERASSKPQRPSWTFPGRWLPMDVATRPVPTPTLPWRQIGAFALIALLLVAALAVYVGSRPRLPEPFGLAANGLIAFVDEGDIYVSDSIEASPRVLIGGSAVDSEVQVSRDGRSIAFLRELGDGMHLLTAGIDGAGVRRLTIDPLHNVTRRSWSPDGSAIAVAHEVDGFPVISIVATDGSGTRAIETPGIAASFPDWRPPDGRELAFRGQTADRTDVYLVRADGSDLRPLDVATLGRASGNEVLLGLTWSPDGTRIAYHSNDLIPDPTISYGDRWQTHVLEVGTGEDTIVSTSTNHAIEDTEPSWSPDGRHVVVQRFRFGHAAWMAVLPADGRDPGLDLDVRSTEYPPSGWRAEFSPDGTSIIGYYDYTDEASAFDPVTGAATPIEWAISDVPTWQRLAP